MSAIPNVMDSCCADPECYHLRSQHKGNGRGGCEVITHSRDRGDANNWQCVCTKFRKMMPQPVDMEKVIAKVRAFRR